MSTLGLKGTRTASLNKWIRLVGVRSTVRWIQIRLLKLMGIGEPAMWRVRPRHVRHALVARLGDSSDMRVFRQIFSEDEYACLRDLRNVSQVVDLGANVGYASIYFLGCFPSARVLAVEPDDRNVEICRINFKPYPDRTKLLHGAVWTERTRLRLARGAFRDGREWSTQVEKPTDGGAGEIEAWDLGSLIEMTGSAQVDLLKIDIEGAEQALFSNGAEKWLPRIRNLCIELHGPECREAFFGALSGYEYELGESGELTIVRNLRSRRG